MKHTAKRMKSKPKWWMEWKKTTTLLLALMMLLSVVPIYALAQDTVPPLSSVTTVPPTTTVQYKAAGGAEWADMTDGTVISVPKDGPGPQFKVIINFEINAGVKNPCAYNATYSVSAPKGLSWTGASAAVLRDGEINIGTLTFPAVGAAGMAILTFNYPGMEEDARNDYIQSLSKLNASLEIVCGLDMAAIKDKTEEQISYEIANTTVTLNLEKNQSVSKTVPTITKTGKWATDGTLDMLWTVSVKPQDYATAAGCVLTDVLAAAHQTYVKDSLTVNGNTNGFIVTDTDGKLTVSLNNALDTYVDANGVVVLSLRTTPTTDAFIHKGGTSTITLENRATLAYGGTVGLPSFTISALVGPISKTVTWLKKDGSAVSGQARTQQWKLTVNPDKYKLDNVTLHDILGEKLKLDVGSILIKVGNGGEQTLREYGGTLSPTNPSVGNGENEFTITLGNVTDSLLITYTTSYDNSENIFFKVKNSAYISFYPSGTGMGDGGIGKLSTEPVNKDYSGSVLGYKGNPYDQSTQQVEWQLAINDFQFPLGTGKVRVECEVVKNGHGQIYVPDSFYYTVGANPTKIPFSPPLKDTTEDLENLRFVLDLSSIFAENQSQTVTLYYHTKGVDEDVCGYNETPGANHVLANKAFLYLDDKQAGLYAYAHQGIKSKVLVKTCAPYTSGDTITWNFEVNYNEMAMPDAIIEDFLPSGVSYDETNPKCKLEIKDDNGQPVDSTSVTTTTDNNGVLRIDLGGLANNRTLKLALTTLYDTDAIGWKLLDGKYVPAEPESGKLLIENKAQLVRRDYPRTALTAVTAKATEIEWKPLLSKSGVVKENEGTVTYTVDVNPMQMDLSKSQEAGQEVTWNKLVDEMSPGLPLDTGNVHLYSLTGSVQGNEVEKSLYTVSYQIREQDGVGELVVTLPTNDVKASYRLVYSATLSLPVGQTQLTNRVSLNGATPKQAVTKYPVIVSEATLTAVATRMALLRIRKACDHSPMLEGAVFGVFDTNKALIGRGVSNAKGEIIFAVAPGQTYTVKELAPPAGHTASFVWEKGVEIQPTSPGTVPADLWNGCADLPTNDEAGSDNYMVIHNYSPGDKGSIVVTKVDQEDHSILLSGAVFTLLEGEREIATKTTDAVGAVTFPDLEHGTTYTLREDTAPVGYITAEPREIKIGQQYMNITVENAKTPKGSIVVTKVDAENDAESGAPVLLSGAAFTLLKDGQEVTHDTTGEKGTIIFKDLEYGTYTLEETRPPEGYLASDSIQVMVDKETVPITVVNKKAVAPDPDPDPEIQEYVYRIDCAYSDYLDGTLTAPLRKVTGEAAIHEEAYTLKLNTADYATSNGKSYTFTGGTVSVGNTSTWAEGQIAAGENTVEIAQPNGVYVILLRYERRETTYVPPNPPRPKPTPTPTPTPSVSPSPTPGETATPSPSPDPTPGPTPTSPSPEPTPSVPPSRPDPRPDQPPPRPLTPTEKEKLDKIVEEAIKNPDIIIRDRDTFEELYEVTIEDLAVPIYWGPDFAVVEVPVAQFVVIGSELVPLGNLPQTGSMWNGMTAVYAGAALLAAGAAVAIVGSTASRKKREED